MDSLDSAFPSLEVITRRILQGMQVAMDRAIEDAAREAIETQRQQRAADADRARDAKLDDLLNELSQEPTLASEPQRQIGSGNSGGAGGSPGAAGSVQGEAPGAELLGQSADASGGAVVGNGAGDSVETATAIESNGRLQGVGGDKPKVINREAAAAMLGEVVKSVREAPRKDAAQIHRSENLAYSAVLLNA